MNQPTKILIYGAGVIGCLYAALLAESGGDVTVLARGYRLASLRTEGLQWILSWMDKSKFGDKFMYRHAMKAP